MIDYAFIGARLKEARIRKNITQEKLAAMTDVGSTHISHIETGMTIPSTKLLVQMMNILDCDPAEVLCMEIRSARPVLNSWLSDLAADCNEDEIKIILKKKMVSERLEQVRDVFIFSCFSGLAYVDVANLKEDNIRKSFDGNLWIITKRQKTNTDVNVPLLDIPKMILEKYKGKLPDGKVLPIISNQKLNAYLKEIADVCGIKKNLTFHLARHTFATTTTLAKGVPIETVSKMLGHTNIETTQIYARITNNKISNDMQGLDKKFVGIEKIYKEVSMK